MNTTAYPHFGLPSVFWLAPWFPCQTASWHIAGHLHLTVNDHQSSHPSEKKKTQLIHPVDAFWQASPTRPSSPYSITSTISVKHLTTLRLHLHQSPVPLEHQHPAQANTLPCPRIYRTIPVRDMSIAQGLTSALRLYTSTRKGAS